MSKEDLEKVDAFDSGLQKLTSEGVVGWIGKKVPSNPLSGCSDR
jgi:hypothetical protein